METRPTDQKCHCSYQLVPTHTKNIQRDAAIITGVTSGRYEIDRPALKSNPPHGNSPNRPEMPLLISVGSNAHENIQRDAAIITGITSGRYEIDRIQIVLNAVLYETSAKPKASKQAKRTKARGKRGTITFAAACFSSSFLRAFLAASVTIFAICSWFCSWFCSCFDFIPLRSVRSNSSGLIANWQMTCVFFYRRD